MDQSSSLYSLRQIHLKYFFPIYTLFVCLSFGPNRLRVKTPTPYASDSIAPQRVFVAVVQSKVQIRSISHISLL
jgi:hypothetical protein